MTQIRDSFTFETYTAMNAAVVQLCGELRADGYLVDDITPPAPAPFTYTISDSAGDKLAEMTATTIGQMGKLSIAGSTTHSIRGTALTDVAEHARAAATDHGGKRDISVRLG